MIKKLVRHPDERGYFEELIRATDDFFAEGFGQLSHTLMIAGVVSLTLHKTQVDWWFCAAGN
jgi:dTDP-4-dehydrorhamnose 3,5-epimerase